VTEISAELSARYGLPVDMTAKIPGLVFAAGALSRGDISVAQIATLNLHFPDLPRLAKRGTSKEDFAALAIMLHRSGMLKVTWDPDLHPRWPAGDPAGRGGEFRPTDAGSAATASQPIGDWPSVLPAQATIIDPIPLPWEMPWEVPFPRPTEIVPPALDIPNEQERTRRPLVNPFPRKRRCVEEWEHAFKYCDEQEKKGNFKPGYGGPGKDYYSCVMGQISEECGGNRLDA
jgi:hypothetical protein